MADAGRNVVTMDKPNFDGAKEELALRKTDTLKVGDMIQEWAWKLFDSEKDRLGAYRWLDGSVIAVVLAPCDNVDWVAMIEWYEGRTVLSWTTITSYQWRASVMFRRRP